MVLGIALEERVGLMKEIDLQLPLKEEEIRRLRVGDVVYFTGTVHTLRDMGHRRAVDMLHTGQADKIPFQTLSQGVLWHCGPIVRKKPNGTWEVLAAGSTTSSRFSALGAELISNLQIRITIGKGTMTAAAKKAMQRTGSVFLNTTGGCAALYAQQIDRVTNVFWEDLGLPEACWVMHVNRLGPLIVGIDANGDSLFENVQGTMERNLEESYAQHRLKKTYAYLPKRVILA